MKIVFMGTPEFAVPSLSALIEAGHRVVSVVTQPEKPRGRGRRPGPSPIKAFALEHGLQVLEPERLKDEAFLTRLGEFNPHLIVVVAYGKILPPRVLGLPRLGCVNVHASLLPEYRGAAPVNWAIIRGEKKTGVSIMLMDRGLDTGPVLLKEEVAIGVEETAGELTKRLSSLGAELLVKAIRLYEEGSINPVPQEEGLASFAPALKKEDGKIDWQRSAGEIKDLVRGVVPWPGAYTFYGGKLLKVHRGTALEENGKTAEFDPGAIVFATQGSFGVKCGHGVFEVLELQPEGKRKMSAGDFLKGYRLSTGDRLG